MAELLNGPAGVKSIQIVNILIDIAPSSTGTITTTIAEVNPGKAVAMPPGYVFGHTGATNLTAITHEVTDATTLTTTWEDDTSYDPSSISTKVAIIEYY